jgi:hypothetical protein
MPQPSFAIDLKPTFTRTQLLEKMASARRANLLRQANYAWNLSPVAYALLSEKGPFTDLSTLVQQTKTYPTKIS